MGDSVAPMRHVQFHIADIELGPRSLPLKYGTVQIVERDDVIDWEIVLHTIEVEPVAQAIHPLAFRAITGADDAGTLTFSHFRGEAALVRWVDTTLVFRGAGLLSGFETGHWSSA